MFKHVCIGRDRVTVELHNSKLRYDKVSSFQDARCMSASEEVWRLLGNGYVERDLNVMQLDIHLPDRHTIYFREGQEKSAANMPKVGSKLSEWFVANGTYP